jgi:type IV secretory pathway TrbL component
MSWIENIRNSSPKKKHYIAVVGASVLLLVIVAVGLFWYQAPYKKEVRPEYSLSNVARFKAIFGNGTQHADSFVEPIDQYFTQ